MQRASISADIVYLDAERRIVGVVQRAPPDSVTPAPNERPSATVLVLPAGFLAQHHLAVGAAVELRYQTPTLEDAGLAR